jgi:TetR/AcrR family fatty acid metabolism transcriptional regulator
VQIFSYKTRQVFQRFQEEVEKADSAVEKMRNLIRRHLEEFQRDRNMAIVYQTETHKIHRQTDLQIREMSKMYTDIIAEIIEYGQQEGSIRRDLYLGLVKRFIIGGIDEVINTWLHSGSQYDLVTMTDPLLELFIRGIGTQEYTRSLPS